ncbi:MAG: HD domain-containing protein [Rhodobacterales bacterium]|nr:HD domain-containing protein [Rhodobacterales bacterium]
MPKQAVYEAVVLSERGAQADGSHDLGHLRRVWRNCCWIADREGEGDRDVLRAAAFLHDVINLPKDSPDRARASRMSAEFSVEFLRGDGFPVAKLPDVFHAIEAHSFAADITPTTLEARILQDADRIDALGAVGIARMMYIAGALGRQLFDADDPWAERRAIDDTRFAIDHFETKIFGLEKTMTTDAGRILAQKRTAIMRQYCANLRKELT